jgi:ATP-dependent Clp protease ATP-binding subunit ClpA
MKSHKRFFVRLLLCVTLLGFLPLASTQYTAFNFLSKLKNKIQDKLLDWVDPCTFDNLEGTNVMQEISSGIGAQPTALKLLSSALGSWSTYRFTGDAKPLILAFTGPVGIGKSEASMLAASAMLNRGKRTVNGHPKGLFLFQGSDYMDESQVGTNQERIRSALYAHFTSCNRKGLVVFDEVQKCAPGILDSFGTLLGARPYVTDPSNPRNKLQIDPSNLLFIFVSDIGKKEMLTQVLQHERREDVPDQRLEVVVRSALDKQWKRLNFGRYIDAVIPFLPLEPTQVQLLRGVCGSCH